ncbi:MAG: hypothetical protein R2806_08590 [Saprospiraceae bacterium]
MKKLLTKIFKRLITFILLLILMLVLILKVLSPGKLEPYFRTEWMGKLPSRAS